MAGHDHLDGRLDLVPMIDCVMLLLLFFILTMHFQEREFTLPNLLPTTQGNGPSSHAIVPPPRVDIVALPAGVGADARPEALAAAWAQGRLPRTRVELRIGGHEPIPLDLREFARPKGPELAAAVARLQAAVAERLGAFERAGTRAEQPDIAIHCFSGLPWGTAALVYDAVRGYEGTRAPALTGDPDELARARAVAFAPPRVRRYAADELGQELAELARLR